MKEIIPRDGSHGSSSSDTNSKNDWEKSPTRRQLVENQQLEQSRGKASSSRKGPLSDFSIYAYQLYDQQSMMTNVDSSKRQREGNEHIGSSENLKRKREESPEATGSRSGMARREHFIDITQGQVPSFIGVDDQIVESDQHGSQAAIHERLKSLKQSYENWRRANQDKNRKVPVQDGQRVATNLSELQELVPQAEAELPMNLQNQRETVARLLKENEGEEQNNIKSRSEASSSTPNEHPQAMLMLTQISKLLLKETEREEKSNIEPRSEASSSTPKSDSKPREEGYKDKPIYDLLKACNRAMIGLENMREWLEQKKLFYMFSERKINAFSEGLKEFNEKIEDHHHSFSFLEPSRDKLKDNISYYHQTIESLMGISLQQEISKDQLKASFSLYHKAIEHSVDSYLQHDASRDHIKAAFSFYYKAVEGFIGIDAQYNINRDQLKAFFSFDRKVIGDFIGIDAQYNINRDQLKHSFSYHHKAIEDCVAFYLQYDTSRDQLKHSFSYHHRNIESSINSYLQNEINGDQLKHFLSYHHKAIESSIDSCLQHDTNRDHLKKAIFCYYQAMNNFVGFYLQCDFNRGQLDNAVVIYDRGVGSLVNSINGTLRQLVPGKSLEVSSTNYSEKLEKCIHDNIGLILTNDKVSVPYRCSIILPVVMEAPNMLQDKDVAKKTISLIKKSFLNKRNKNANHIAYAFEMINLNEMIKRFLEILPNENVNVEARVNIVSYGTELVHYLRKKRCREVLVDLVKMISNDTINQNVRCEIASEAVRIVLRLTNLTNSQVIENLQAMSRNDLNNQRIRDAINNAFIRFNPNV